VRTLGAEITAHCLWLREVRGAMWLCVCYPGLSKSSTSCPVCSSSDLGPDQDCSLRRCPVCEEAGSFPSPLLPFVPLKEENEVKGNFLRGLLRVALAPPSEGHGGCGEVAFVAVKPPDVNKAATRAAIPEEPTPLRQPIPSPQWRDCRGHDAFACGVCHLPSPLPTPGRWPFPPRGRWVISASR